MPTLPTTGENLDLINFVFDEQPSYTHKLDIDRKKVSGMTDERDALYQAIYLILNVDRYAFPIYSWHYGIEKTDLIGKPKDYVMSELKRRVNDAIGQDDRITGTGEWVFEGGRHSIHAAFIVYTIYGEIKMETEVDI